MTTHAPAPAARRPAVNPEWALAVLALLTFLLIPIHINTIYSGLPAHPLFLHVPVILIPLATIAAIVLVARPQLFVRHGIWVGLVAVVALGALNLTMGAGDQLRADLGLYGPGLISQHAAAAGKLRVLTILFVAALLIAVAVYRTAGPAVTGVGAIDRALALVRTRPALAGVLRVAIGVLAIASLYFVFRTGDLGAKAVWQHRLHGGGFGGPGAGGSGPPSGGASSVAPPGA